MRHPSPLKAFFLLPELLFAPELFRKGDSRVHGWLGQGAQGHPSLQGGAIALEGVAAIAGGNYVIPGMLPAFRSRNDVIERQVFRTAAVLAGVAISPQHFPPVDRWNFPDSLSARDSQADVFRHIQEAASRSHCPTVATSEIHWFGFVAH